MATYFALGTLAIVLASAGGTLARAQPPKKACSEPAYRQFDFWIGEWDVLLPDGKPAGRNHIVSIAGGCGIEEQWTGAGGGSGRSLNTYDAADKRWHQFWVGGDGTVLQLAGSFAGNVMTLENAANRIRFTRNADGTIRQQWDSSADGGKTWKTVFDGKYVRARGSSGAAASSPRDLLSSLMKADNAGDLDGVIRLYSDQAVLLPPNEPVVTGKAAIRARYTRLFATTRMDVRFEVDEDGVGDRIGFLRGRTIGKRVATVGRGIEDLSGKFTMLLKPDGGGWTISSLIWNADR